MSTLAVAAAGVSVETRSLAATEATKRAVAKLVEDGIPAKLAAKDPSLWGTAAGPVAAARLGWLDAPTISRGLLSEFAQLAERVHADRLDHIVLAGIGGASLAPEVIARTAGAPLTVLDTTDPHQVATALGDRLDSTLVIVSSKSGTTIETDSHRRIYARALQDLGLTPEEVARRIVIVTDPGSPLEQEARKAGYHVVLADPNVGGRFSALTAFGLTPSALAGVDVAALLDQAAAVLPALAGEEDNPGLVLGAALGGFAADGHGKAVIADHGSGISGFGDWAQQLLAESTGKQGLGILPVAVESADAPGFSPGPDIHLVALGPAEPARLAAGGGRQARPQRPADTAVAGPLGAQFLVWEYATALAGRIIGINPFDQPNVQESKDNTVALLARSGDGPLPVGEPVFVEGVVEVHADPGRLHGATDLAGVIDSLIWSLPEGGYLAIMAYLDRISDGDAARLRTALAVRTTHPVTFGWGPRLLHSTGQYHKGGPQTGVFLQITGSIERDVQVPDAPYSLGRLQLAQALGDLGALRGRGRPAVRLHLRNRAAGLRQLLAAGAGTGHGPAAPLGGSGAAGSGAAGSGAAGSGVSPHSVSPRDDTAWPAAEGTMTDGWMQGGATAGGTE